MSELQSLPGTTRILQPIINGQKLEKTLYVDTDHLDRCIELWSLGGFDQLGLESYNDNFKLNSTELLKQFPDVRRLHINLDRRIDLSGLSYVAERLVVLFINDDINTVTDLTPFKSLERLGIRWSQKTRFPNEVPSLRSLALTHFKPETRDLTNLPQMPSLKTFALALARLESLKGLERLCALQKLSLYRVQGLSTINEIGTLRTLQELDIDCCKGSFDLSSTLRPSTQLTTLRYTCSAPFSSLTFISDLPKLDELVFLDTDVTDGDMSPLANHQSLRHVAFTKKKHFSHSEKEINALYAARKEK